MLEFLIIMQPSFIAILPALIVLLLGYRMGLIKYLNEKKNELITKRYLENGVDKVLAGVEHALAVHNENWKRGLNLLKEFRECRKANIKLRKTTLEKEFIDYDLKHFSVEPFYKIKALVGDDIYWESYQLLYFFIGENYNFLENDLKLAIESIENGSMKAPIDKFCDKYMEKLIEIQTESDKYYKIQLELFNISMALEDVLFELENLSFKNIKAFKDKPEIKKGIEHLKDVFGEEANEMKKLKLDKIESENK